MSEKEFFEKGKDLGFSNLQITEKHTINSSVEVIDGEIDSFDDYDNTDYEIKGEINGKTCKSKSNYLGEDVLEGLKEKIEGTESKYEDEYLEKEENIPSKELPEFDISNEIKILKNLESLRKEYPEVQKLTTYFDETETNTRIMNNHGVDISTSSHLCNFVVEVVIEGEEITSFDRSFLTTNKQEIDFLSFTRDVIEKGILQRKRKKLETKKYDILLDSCVAGRILSHLISMLSATSIRNKVSCMENKLDEKIFNEKLTILEDPTNEKYPGYRLFDDEGIKTKKKIVVEDGVLKTYFYNVKEAKMKNIPSTGNGYQGINTKNLIIVPGEKELESLIKEMKDGVYIVDFMGSSNTSINPVNGAISLQIFGFLVKDGKIVSGIEPSIMTTTIFELFSHIQEVGKDLTFTRTSSASPSLWIKDISIAR